MQRSHQNAARVSVPSLPQLDGVRHVEWSLDLAEYERLHEPGRSVPVSVWFDDPGWDPVDLVEALPETTRVDLLETPGGPAGLTRRSFLAWAPEYELIVRRNVLETWQHGERVHEQDASHPLQTVRGILQREGANTATAAGAEGFRGGLVGFLSYEFKNHLETLPDTVLDDLETPDLRLGFVRRVLSWDHRAQRIGLCVNLQAQSQDAAADFGRVMRSVKELYAEVVSLEVTRSLAHAGVAAAAQLEQPPRTAPQALRSNLSRQAYDRMLATAKEHILAGNIYQANLSHRFEAPFRGSGVPLYRHLRRINPSPFATYIRLPAMGPLPASEIVSCSPERLVCSYDGRVETRPIAGTRPRHVDSHADGQLERELLDSDKERAEHVMIVDMARNDIGRACRLGTVRVESFMSVERYSHVRHLVSNIVGELSEECDGLDVLAATFPGASITGVPKVRCMQIIDELEMVRRGIYTGSAGYIGLDGALDFNILIRSFLLQEGRAWFHVGGGIVADSDSRSEYEETLSKGRVLYEALVAVSQGGSGNGQDALVANTQDVPEDALRQQRFVFLNQSLLEADEARVSVDDAGFLLGDGVFETCGAFAGVPFLLEEHVKRLRSGLRFTQIDEPARLRDLASIVEDVVRANHLQGGTARLRITVTRGSGNGPTFLVSAQAWTPPVDLEDGVHLDFAHDPVQISPWRQVKSTSRQASALAGLRRKPGVYDSLLWNTQGMLTEGTYSNLFCVDSSARVCTPPTEDGCLAGVTRAAVLQVARDLGFETVEASIRPASLPSMKEIFLTSSMSSVVPVCCVEFPGVAAPEWQPIAPSAPIEWASPGSVTSQIRAAYGAWLKESTCRPR